MLTPEERALLVDSRIACLSFMCSENRPAKTRIAKTSIQSTPISPKPKPNGRKSGNSTQSDPRSGGEIPITCDWRIRCAVLSVTTAPWVASLASCSSQSLTFLSQRGQMVPQRRRVG